MNVRRHIQIHLEDAIHGTRQPCEQHADGEILREVSDVLPIVDIDRTLVVKRSRCICVLERRVLSGPLLLPHVPDPRPQLLYWGIPIDS